MLWTPFFGGTVMSWIDIAGAIASQRHSGMDVVTASIDRLNFIAPVRRGWVVNLKASVNYTSRTSMEVGIRVDAENPKTGEIFHTASAYMTFVALGSDGRPAVIPGLLLENDVERRRFAAAEKRRQQLLASKNNK
jgi:acyl-CoA hydrolase